MNWNFNGTLCDTKHEFTYDNVRHEVREQNPPSLHTSLSFMREKDGRPALRTGGQGHPVPAAAPGTYDAPRLMFFHGWVACVMKVGMVNAMRTRA
jgi:hypothetical protein